MKNRNLLIGLLITTMVVGCTSATQPIAAQALKTGIKQESDIIEQYRKETMQNITDSQVAKARDAATKKDEAAAQAAVEGAVTKVDVVRYLSVQHERAKAMLRIAQGYIWEQQGVLNVLINEFETAKSEVAASQPSNK